MRGQTFHPDPVDPATHPAPAHQPSLAAWQKAQGLVADPPRVEVAPDDIPDLTRDPLLFPVKPAHTLQSLARPDTGGMLALGYAAMRAALATPVPPSTNRGWPRRMCRCDIRAAPCFRRAVCAAVRPK
jgi:hypothetical protein